MDHAPQKEIASQFSLVQENERKQIAKLLHDEIGNKLNIMFLWVTNEEAWSDERSRSIIAELMPKLIETTRNLSHSLYPSSLENFGLILSLEDLIAHVDGQLNVLINITGLYIPRDIAFEVQIYRIIQEFLTNVIKHAQASHMWIQLRDTDFYFSLVLSDNGIGFDSRGIEKGMGINNMESRLNSIQARWKWKTKADGGTRLLVLIPKK